MVHSAHGALSKCFITSVVNYKAAPFAARVFVYVYVCKDPKMAPVKRHAYGTDLKFKVISHAVAQRNKAAVRDFNINESMVWN